MGYHRGSAFLEQSASALETARILGEKTVELMTRSHTAGIDMSWALRRGYDFGLGVAVHAAGAEGV